MLGTLTDYFQNVYDCCQWKLVLAKPSCKKSSKSQNNETPRIPTAELINWLRYCPFNEVN